MASVVARSTSGGGGAARRVYRLAVNVTTLGLRIVSPHGTCALSQAGCGLGGTTTSDGTVWPGASRSGMWEGPNNLGDQIEVTRVGQAPTEIVDAIFQSRVMDRYHDREAYTDHATRQKPLRVRIVNSLGCTGAVAGLLGAVRAELADFGLGSRDFIQFQSAAAVAPDAQPDAIARAAVRHIGGPAKGEAGGRGPQEECEEDTQTVLLGTVGNVEMARAVASAAVERNWNWEAVVDSGDGWWGSGNTESTDTAATSAIVLSLLRKAVGRDVVLFSPTLSTPSSFASTRNVLNGERNAASVVTHVCRVWGGSGSGAKGTGHGDTLGDDLGVDGERGKDARSLGNGCKVWVEICDAMTGRLCERTVVPLEALAMAVRGNLRRNSGAVNGGGEMVGNRARHIAVCVASSADEAFKQALSAALAPVRDLRSEVLDDYDGPAAAERRRLSLWEVAGGHSVNDNGEICHISMRRRCIGMSNVVEDGQGSGNETNAIDTPEVGASDGTTEWATSAAPVIARALVGLELCGGGTWLRISGCMNLL